MEYNKTTWASKDIITANKLNNIENGIEALNSELNTTLTNSNKSISSLDTRLSLIEQNQDLGLTTKYKGTYSGSTTYYKDDIIDYEGKEYICIVTSSSAVLPTNTTNWSQLNLLDNVRYNVEQDLTVEQQERVRNNIGASSLELAKAICPAVTIGSSPIITVTDAVPLTADVLTVGINAVQAGSDDPSPSNLRPITGWTGVNVTISGKNVLQLPASSVDGDLTFTRELDGTLSISGTASKNVTYYFNRYSSGRSLYGDYIVTVVGTAYTGDGWLYITKADQSGSASRYIGGETGANLSVRCAEGIGNMYLYIPKNSVISESHLQIMVRPASIADDTFEPCQCNTYVVSFGAAGTVYGGTLDVLTGKLTVTHTSIDLSTLTWQSNTGYYISTSAPNGIKTPASNDAIADIICSNYMVASANDVSSGVANGIGVRTNGKLYVTDYDVSPTGLLVYKLSGLMSYNLTAQQITMLTGTNNIWADTGDTTLTYRANPYTTLMARIAELETLTT